MLQLTKAGVINVVELSIAAQAGLSHAGNAASAAELDRARAEIALLGDRLARAQCEADSCRQQMREAQVLLCWCNNRALPLEHCRAWLGSLQLIPKQ